MPISAHKAQLYSFVAHVVAFVLIWVLFLQHWGTVLYLQHLDGSKGSEQAKEMSSLVARLKWMEERQDVAALMAGVADLQDSADALEMKIIALQEVAREPEDLLQIVKEEVNVGLVIIRQVAEKVYTDQKRVEEEVSSLRFLLQEIVNGRRPVPCACSTSEETDVAKGETTVTTEASEMKEVSVATMTPQKSLLDVVFWNVTFVSP